MLFVDVRRDLVNPQARRAPCSVQPAVIAQAKRDGSDLGRSPRQVKRIVLMHRALRNFDIDKDMVAASERSVRNGA